MFQVAVKDSHKKNRVLEIVYGFVKASGQKCAQFKNDKDSTYFTRVNSNGTGDCTCDGNAKYGKVCYHMTTLVGAQLSTGEEIDQQYPDTTSIGEVMATANEAIRADEPAMAAYLIGDCYQAAPSKNDLDREANYQLYRSFEMQLGIY